MRSEMEHSIVVHSTKDGTFCIIALYVDDLMILSNDSINLGHRKDKLMRTFKMKDLGPIHWFLGLEIVCDRSCRLISVSQTQYVTDIMSRFNFINSCPISTPVPANFKLPRLDAPEIDTHQYQSHIGSFMYIMLR